MDNFLDVANSGILFLIVLVAITFVIAQSVVFLRLATKRAAELNMEKETIKKVMTNSAVFTILPSLPIVLVMTALMPILGNYLPWIRLSVVGSSMYESMCADLTITAFGYAGLGDTTITTSVFISVIYVMSFVALAWPIFNIVGLKFYDRNLKKMQKSGGFMKVASGALFIGLMAVMAVPRAFDFENFISIAVILASGLSVVMIDIVSNKTGIKILSDFSFPLAMLIGMATAIIIGY